MKKVMFLLVVLFGLASVGSVFGAGDSFTYVYRYDYDLGYTAPLNVGGELFSGGSLVYGCGDVGERSLSVGMPSDSCWRSSVDFGDESFVLSHNEVRQLNPYLSVKMVGYGTVWYTDTLNGWFKTPESWSVSYVFTFTDDSFFGVSVSDDSLVELGSFKQVPVVVNSEFSVFGGLLVRQYDALLNGIQTDVFEQKYLFFEGSSTYFFGMDSSSLGVIDYSVEPFIYVDVPVLGGDGFEFRLFNDDSSVVSYRVVPEVDSVDTGVGCLSDSDCPSGFFCETYAYSGGETRICEKDRDSRDPVNVPVSVSGVETDNDLLLVGVGLLVLLGVVLWMKQ